VGSEDEEEAVKIAPYRDLKKLWPGSCIGILRLWNEKGDLVEIATDMPRGLYDEILAKISRHIGNRSRGEEEDE
jgi:hypothetical protein